jgi:hypothetical protein
VTVMTAPAPDRSDQVPRCPNPTCNPRGKPRPLHAVTTADPGTVECRRCHRRYNLTSDASHIVWTPRSRQGCPLGVGGTPIGGVLLGPERQRAVETAAAEDGVDRAEMIRRLIDLGLGQRAARRGRKP